MLVVSLGTGRVHKANYFTNRHGWFVWVGVKLAIVEAFMRGSAQEVDFIVHALTYKRQNKIPHQYLRVNPFLSCPDERRLDISGLDKESIDRIRGLFPASLVCDDGIGCVSQTNLDNLVRLGDLCAEKLPELLDIKLPSCKSHADYSGINLDNLADQLIANHSEDRSFTLQPVE